SLPISVYRDSCGESVVFQPSCEVTYMIMTISRACNVGVEHSLGQGQGRISLVLNELKVLSTGLESRSESMEPVIGIGGSCGISCPGFSRQSPLRVPAKQQSMG